MSLSDSAAAPRLVRVEARCSMDDPADALRIALSDLMAALAREGAAPGDIRRIEILAREPLAFHLSRRQMDLAWREVCGGLRRPVTYARSDANLCLRAEAHVRAPQPDAPVWRGMTRAEIARGYHARAQADMRQVFRRWNYDGMEARAGQSGLDLAYGPGREQCLDFYPAADAKAPLWVFLHGGYWQACTKDQHGQFGEGMRAHGFAVAQVDYGLAPETTLVEMVAQVRVALRFLVDQAESFGFDPERVHLAGHSAGAQLAAMAAVDPEGPRVASALLLSGLYDLTPLSFLPMGEVIGLHDSDLIRRLSPLSFPPPAGVRIGVALGALETDEFKRQSAEFAQAWGAPAPLIVEGRHHFDLLEDLRDPGALLDLALNTAGAR
ncbi:MAG: alpha/beta hydrolase [Beijerinckiaceae bacterium]|nr:alpha/beta hydrolase [Beijerinckiaceae bacterium]